MQKLTIEIQADGVINARWDEEIKNEEGKVIGYALPIRRAFSPHSIADREFIEAGSGELKAYAAIAWANISYPTEIN